MFTLTPEELTAVLLSLKVAFVATLASLPFGVAVAWLLARKDFPGKALLDAFGFPFRKGEMPASTKRSKKQTKKKSVVQGNS